jgi:hypothetical protein
MIYSWVAPGQIAALWKCPRHEGAVNIRTCLPCKGLSGKLAVGSGEFGGMSAGRETVRPIWGFISTRQLDVRLALHV